MSDRSREEKGCQILPDGEEARLSARRAVEAGGVFAFRTDTFYGLGADPFNQKAVGTVNRLKGREGGKPILIIISDPHEAERFIEHQSKLFNLLVEHFWPGPLTIVAGARASVHAEITAGTETVGVRLPADEDVQALVRACGGALTATSANLAGQPPARTASEVASYFPHELELIVDGGPSRTDKPSTVIDVTGERARLVREGEISRAALERSLKSFGEALKDNESSEL